MVKNEARANFNKDQALRFWATTHGGVYAPITGQTPPNPYLSHVKERDIKTPDGKALTLMNSAYMLRQTMENYESLYGVRGHITSLKHFREETAPDEWEKSALQGFESGAKEIFEFTEIDGKSYFRYMSPMIAKEGCLKCHGHQGYKMGDVRGRRQCFNTDDTLSGQSATTDHNSGRLTGFIMFTGFCRACLGKPWA